jgi:ABC-type phosphate/phosphonate transport system substrate-binding protein
MGINIAGNGAFILWIVLSSLLLPTGAVGRDPSGEPLEPVFVTGYSASLFEDVDIKDAQVVTRIWGDMIAKKRGGRANTVIYDSLLDFESDVDARKIDLAVLASNELFGIRKKALFEPALISVRSASVYEDLLVVTRKDNGMKGIKDLQDKRFIILRGQYGAVITTWLETLLMKEGFQNPRHFFSSIKEVKKASQAALPVFFKQADACLLNRHAFDLLAELNPQLRTELMPIARFDGIAGGILSFRGDYNEQDKETVRDMLGTLHQDPQGKQLLMLFKVDQLVPFKPEYLNAEGTLLKEHRDLKSRMPKVKQ